MANDRGTNRVLVAEDDRLTAHQLRAVLTSRGYEVVVAHDGEVAWNLLKQAGSPNLAILDWKMPGLSGVDICRRVRGMNREPYTYILLLTEKTSREDLLVGMKSGADDYLTKPFDANELEVRLGAGQRVLTLMDELIAMRETLRHEATYDSVTGLQNHTAVCKSLNREMARAKRAGTTLGVIMADLDHFKHINDTFGHLAGDAVLAEVGRRIDQQIRSQDSAGRYGGEEFLIVLPGCDLESAYQRGDALRTYLGQSEVQTTRGPISISASVGVAVYHGADRAGTDQVIGAADAALYQAKKLGRNRVAVAEPFAFATV
jgi:two-component system, cell cycle response regulator